MDESEVEAFQKFVAKPLSLQEQLDPAYHHDRFLRDTLLASMDIRSIHTSLGNMVPCTAQQLSHSIISRPSYKPRIAGAVTALYTPSYK